MVSSCRDAVSRAPLNVFWRSMVMARLRAAARLEVATIGERNFGGQYANGRVIAARGSPSARDSSPTTTTTRAAFWRQASNNKAGQRNSRERALAFSPLTWPIAALAALTYCSRGSSSIGGRLLPPAECSASAALRSRRQSRERRARERRPLPPPSPSTWSPSTSHFPSLSQQTACAVAMLAPACAAQTAISAGQRRSLLACRRCRAGPRFSCNRHFVWRARSRAPT